MEPFIGIEKNRLTIKNTKEEYILRYNEDLDIYVNDRKINRTIIITDKDKVEISNEGEKAKRKLDIKISEDKLLAYLNIEYIRSTYSDIEVNVDGNTISLTKKDEEGEMPPSYKKEEIISALKSYGVIYGLNKDVLENLKEYENVKDIIVATGIAPKNDEDDIINVNFENIKRAINPNSKEKVDYKNFYTSINVSIGEVLGEKITGKLGQDGIDVFGKKIVRKMKVNKKFKPGDGCRLEENKIISTVEGRPSVKNGIFSVNKVFEISTDVDISKGNITFIGDVEISGALKDGMAVKAGNSVTVAKNVESASIIAQGQVTVKGNALNSKILAGARDVEKQEYLETLKSYKNDIEGIISGVDLLKKYGQATSNKTDGELISTLISRKYKKIPRISMLILTNNRIIGSSNSKIDEFIRNNLIGSYILSIKYVTELYKLIEYLNEEIVLLENQIDIPVDIYLSYSQDSKVKASGNIIITGKGQYVSELIANKNIEFTENDAICRGGTLIAGGNINARVIGSSAGVDTKLKVPRDGIITADVVYNNTTFIFGERQYTLETPSKNVKAYLDKDGDVVIDKFVL